MNRLYPFIDGYEPGEMTHSEDRFLRHLYGFLGQVYVIVMALAYHQLNELAVPIAYSYYKVREMR
jgi:hypothetical protein